MAFLEEYKLCLIGEFFQRELRSLPRRFVVDYTLLEKVLLDHSCPKNFKTLLSTVIAGRKKFSDEATLIIYVTCELLIAAVRIRDTWFT